LDVVCVLEFFKTYLFGRFKFTKKVAFLNYYRENGANLLCYSVSESSHGRQRKVGCLARGQQAQQKIHSSRKDGAEELRVEERHRMRSPLAQVDLALMSSHDPDVAHNRQGAGAQLPFGPGRERGMRGRHRARAARNLSGNVLAKYPARTIICWPPFCRFVLSRVANASRACAVQSPGSAGTLSELDCGQNVRSMTSAPRVPLARVRRVNKKTLATFLARFRFMARTRTRMRRR